MIRCPRRLRWFIPALALPAGIVIADDAAWRADFAKVETIGKRDPETPEALAAARGELRAAAAAFVLKYGEDAEGERLYAVGLARGYSGDHAGGVKALRLYLETVPEGERRKEAFLALLALLEGLERPEEGLEAIESFAEGFKGNAEVEEIVADQLRSFGSDVKRKSLIGQAAPGLEILEVLGDGVKSIEALKGRVVLLDFFATWCLPCRQTIPWLAGMREKRGEAGLTVLGVTEYYGYGWLDGETRENLSKTQELDLHRKFRESMKINYPVILTADKEGGEKYGVLGIPGLFLIDRKGVVRKVEVGAGDHGELEKVIGELLAEKD